MSDITFAPARSGTIKGAQFTGGQLVHEGKTYNLAKGTIVEGKITAGRLSGKLRGRHFVGSVTHATLEAVTLGDIALSFLDPASKPQSAPGPKELRGVKLLDIAIARATIENAEIAPASAFIAVPPVWSTPVGEQGHPHISAAAVCGLDDDLRKSLPSEKDVRCEAFTGAAFTDPKQNLGEQIAAAIKALAEINALCAKDASSAACAALYVKARPFDLAGRERISAIADDTEDRDLDGSQRLTPDDKATSTAVSAEARFVEGLTNFVMDRAKLEAVIYFEERFHTTLCEADAADPRVSYFDSTCNVLTNAKSAGFSIASASRELRAAARRDLRALPDRALHQQYFDSGETLYPMMRIWLGLAARLRDNTLAPQSVFAALTNIDPAICRAQQQWMRAREGVVANAAAAENDCHRALHTFALVGSVLDLAVRLGETDGLRKSDLTDAVILAYQAGVPAQTPYKPAFGAQFLATLRAIHGLNPADAAQEKAGKTILARFRNSAANVRGIAKEARERQGTQRNEKLRALAAELTLLADDMLDLVDASALALSGCTEAVCGLDGTRLRERIALGTRTARNNARLARDVLEDRWVVVAVEVSKLFLNAERGGRSVALAQQYAPVIAEVAGAKSSIEVQRILSEAAAPAGSYREKFRGNTRSITALVGFGAGKEHYSTSDTSSSSTGNFYGLFAPVGIHVTTPIAEKHRWFGGAIGAYVSILDLGPYATVRSGAEGVDKQASIGLKQLLSPGIYLTHNISAKDPGWGLIYSWFNKSPWVWGFGVSRTTALYENNQGRDVSSTRAQIFFAIDVTLFPF